MRRRPIVRLAATSIVAAGCVACAGSAFAQMADPATGDNGLLSGTLGGAVAGGAGLRGSTDAIGDETVPNDPSTLPGSGAATPGTTTQPSPVNQRMGLLPLRGTALPERYPVELPDLKAYPRSARIRKGSGDENPPVRPQRPNLSTAAIEVIPRRTLTPDADPFGPIGYQVATVRVFPFIEQSFGFDSNPDQVSSGIKASAFSRTEGGFAVQSNWLGAELRGTARGGYDAFFDNPRANRPDGTGVMDLRIDATHDTQLDVEGRYTIDTQRSDSPELNVAVRDRPLITSVGATAGVTELFGRFSVGLHGLYDRTDYENGSLSDGTIINLAYQDFNDYGVKARVGYDLRPGLQPFVEVGYDRRIHDDTVDIFGYRRDSDGVGARLGSTFELWPQLTGTVSAGYADRFYDDPRLADLAGPTANATIVWTATPLTTVTLLGSTAFNETNVIGSSGIESRAISLSVSHALFRYLTLTGSLGYEQDDYQGVSIKEDTLTAALKAEYHLSRSLVLTGTISHQQLKSTVQGFGYTQDIAMLGLRAQH